jgi:hypothetical protein
MYRHVLTAGRAGCSGLGLAVCGVGRLGPTGLAQGFGCLALSSDSSSLKQIDMRKTNSEWQEKPYNVATTLVLFVLFHAQPRSSGSFVQCHKQSPEWNSYTVGGLEYSKLKQLSMLSRGPADWNLPPSSTFHVCAFLTCNRSYLPLQKGVERRVVCIVCRAAHVPQLSQTATALGKTLLRHCHFDCIVLYFDVFRCI